MCQIAKAFTILVVSEDVLEETPVNGREEGEELLLFQQGGSISPVDVCTTLPGLKDGCKAVRVMILGCETTSSPQTPKIQDACLQIKLMCAIPSPRLPAKPAPLLLYLGGKPVDETRSSGP